MSDLYFFLKHAARKNQLLIIDEPESHLNTANQIEMARLLARCVNNGLKVLITTHSDYLIKEFNNLIMLSQDFSGKEKFIDGSGVTDIIYLKADGVYIYLNESGNRWADAEKLKLFPHIDNLSSVIAVDLLGNGTAWSGLRHCRVMHTNPCATSTLWVDKSPTCWSKQ